MSYGNAVVTSRPSRIGVLTSNQQRARRAKRQEKMKLTFKQKIRNWLMNDSEDHADEYITQDIEPSRLDSNGLRLQIYKASGGYVVETRSYDRRKDENLNTMHVITEEQDLGDALGKIVMIEALRG